MSIQLIPPGRALPNDFNVIIEIPAQGAPVKYEVDKASGALFVDRFLSTCMHYPCNYGYIPGTLSEDGDPTDVLVLTPYPVVAGSVIRCRPIDMLRMTDESGMDAKILAVPVDKLCMLYKDVQSMQDLPSIQTAQISHFFEHYKDLEPNKWVKVDGWAGTKAAQDEILASVERYKAK